MKLSLLILVCIHKSYIVYLEIYVVPLDFNFLVMEKSWKINVEKEGDPEICISFSFWYSEDPRLVSPPVIKL